MTDQPNILEQFRAKLVEANKATPGDAQTLSEKILSEIDIPKEIDTPELRAALNKAGDEITAALGGAGLAAGNVKVISMTTLKELFEELKALKGLQESATESGHQPTVVFADGAISAIEWALGLVKETPIKILHNILVGKCDCTACREKNKS